MTPSAAPAYTGQVMDGGGVKEGGEGVKCKEMGRDRGEVGMRQYTIH